MLKKHCLFVLFLLAISTLTMAQNCNHINLSLKYNYKISVVKKKDEDDFLRTTKIIVEIMNKSTKKAVQRIIISEDLDLMESDYTDCNYSRSYVTSKSIKKQDTEDGINQDIVVGDINFDGKEDLAIKVASGNSGTLYKFFAMTKEGLFQEDNFLHKNVGYYPNEMNSKNKTITTWRPLGVDGVTQSVFKYDEALQKWKMIKRQYKNI